MTQLKPKSTLVSPGKVPPDLEMYWRQAEIQARAFLEQAGRLSDGAYLFGVQVFCHWAPINDRRARCWHGWGRRFDRDMVRRIAGKRLVRYGVPDFLASDESVIADVLCEFVAYLGSQGIAASEDVERLSVEFRSALPFLLARLQANRHREEAEDTFW